MANPKVSQAEFDAAIAVVSNTDWIRLAAYVDGEGTIMISKSRTKTGRGNPNYVLMLIVANTHPLLIKWLCDTFPATAVYSHSSRSRMEVACGVQHRKPCFSWRQFEERAAIIIERILPYLIMKKDQAKVALAYRELRKAGSKGRKVTAEDLAAREEMRSKMRELNSGDWVRQEK